MVKTLILDFADAFMGIPLSPAESPFNVCELEVPIERTRAAS